MNITPSALTRAGAVALAIAGVIFIVIQPLHPHEEVASIVTSTWVVVHLLSLTMAVLGLAGITAIYLNQVTRSGILGLLGYLVFSLFFITQAAVNFTEAFILPLTAASSPKLTEDVASLFVSGYVLQTDVGPLAIVGSLGAVLYLGGGVLFGIALLRAKTLPRWTGILLIAASLASLLAAVIPHELARYAAVPMGIALIALGAALFVRQRKSAVAPSERHLEHAHA
ncbi:MAG TPA: hypothetical protein VGO31_14915 [Microbacteriaceae bacterium]|jgi:hypothetical protein|nr:hypothetical protein [Microbacteriaceae bacterium]